MLRMSFDNNRQLESLPVSMPEELTMNINDLSMCESFSEYYEVLGAAVNVVRNDRTICCPSMRLTFRKYPKVSGTFSLGPKVVNNRQWWRNGGFAIWFDGRSNWVIGLVRNLLQKQYRNAFAVSGTKTNCPVDIRIWKIVKENRKVKTKMTCKCCNLLTVKGSLYIQNPKYGIYSIDGQRGGSLVYKQRWPTKPYNNNYIYYTGGRFIINDKYGRTMIHHGIEAENNNACPTSVDKWKSWTGVGSWHNDPLLKVECANEYEICYQMNLFCSIQPNPTDCLKILAQCRGKDSTLCEAKVEELYESCFYGRC